jgi:hypothetical protein
VDTDTDIIMKCTALAVLTALLARGSDAHCT